jgi:AsmA protein
LRQRAQHLRDIEAAQLAVLEADIDGSTHRLGELAVSTIRMAPVFIEASLRDGVMNIMLADTGLYGGKAAGAIVVDVSKPELRHTMQINLAGVRAMPLLAAFADFRALDGVMQAKFDLHALGASARAIAETVGGTVDVTFKDGELRSLNIAQMLRSLTQTKIKGWSENKSEKTDLTELSANFRIDAGRATTDNLKIAGPLVRVAGAGSADLAAKTLSFKLDTKLVMSLQGQGSTDADPVGFGVPVMVEGSWESPEIYPDISGILDNPDAAYGKLRELGGGLLGGDGKSGGNALMQGLGNLLGGGEQKPGAPQTGDGKPATPPNKDQGLNDILKGLLGK